MGHNQRKLLKAVGGAAELILVLRAFNSASNADATIPTVVAGDLLLSLALGNGSNDDDVAQIPAGWTELAFDDVAGTSSRFVQLLGKVASGSESGSLAVFDGSLPNTQTVMSFKFDGGETLASLGSILDVNAEFSNGIPSNQIKNASSIGAAPFVVLAGYCETLTSTAVRGFAGATEDGEVEGVANKNYLKWKLYPSGSGADITVSKTDGGRNGLVSCILNLNL